MKALRPEENFMKYVIAVLALVSISVTAHASKLRVGQEVLCDRGYSSTLKGKIVDIASGGGLTIDFGDPVFNLHYGTQLSSRYLLPYRHANELVVRNMFYIPRFTLKIGQPVIYRDSATWMRGEITDLTEDGFALVDFHDYGANAVYKYVKAGEYLTPDKSAVRSQPVAAAQSPDAQPAANAQPADSAESKVYVDPARERALAWVKSHLGGETGKDIPGHTPAGEACALFLTDRSYGSTPDYYVVVGYVGAKAPNDYIGTVASQSFAHGADSLVFFDSENSWGNASQFNRVRINTGADGNPLEAIGVSDIKTIKCKMD
jgi:hypothetical protein